jgi:hypothetical protein
MRANKSSAKAGSSGAGQGELADLVSSLTYLEVGGKRPSREGEDEGGQGARR